MGGRPVALDDQITKRVLKPQCGSRVSVNLGRLFARIRTAGGLQHLPALPPDPNQLRLAENPRRTASKLKQVGEPIRDDAELVGIKEKIDRSRDRCRDQKPISHGEPPRKLAFCRCYAPDSVMLPGSSNAKVKNCLIPGI